MAWYDGNRLVLSPNPDNGLGYLGLPIIYNNNLYVEYENKKHLGQLAKCSNNSLSLVPNPTAAYWSYDGWPIVYEGQLYLKYTDGTALSYLARLDSNNITAFDKCNKINTLCLLNSGFYGYTVS